MRVSDYVRQYAAAAGLPRDRLPERDTFANHQQLLYDDSATRRELGIAWARTLEESLPEHMDYLRRYGQLSLAVPGT
jgi:hypothetical protein